MARDPQNLHGPALLPQCPQDAPQHPQPSLFTLSLLRSYKGLAVGDQTKATSILLSSQLPRCLSCRHGLRLKKAVSGSRCGRCGRPRAQLVSSLFHHHTSPSLRLLPDTLESKIHPYYFDCFRLGAPAAYPPRAPKHSGTCASSFPYSSSASPPSGQPLSCSLPWQPPLSIIQA